MNDRVISHLYRSAEARSLVHEKRTCRLALSACAILGAACILLLAASPAFARRSAPGSRIRLIPHLAPGQTFRYAVQMHSTIASFAAGPVIDAGGPGALSQSIGLVIRLDVLSASNASGQPASVRIRATYEKVAVSSNSAAYDPDVAAMEAQYKKLEGKSMEFTLALDGKITDLTGMKNLVSATDPSRAATLSQWLSQLTLGASLPKQGIAIGDKWSSVQPIENTPLAGLAWKTTATYVRNEPCPAASAPSPSAGVSITPAAIPEQCAVIMTRAEITGGRGSKDRTPDVFRKNGLRTSGVWTGATESLSAISLRTGMVSSVTQTASSHMDFTIMTTLQRTRMRYAGDTHSQSVISLLPQSPIP